METIFLNSQNSKIFDPHRLLLQFLDKTILKRSDKYVPLLSIIMYYAWENV